jgi:uncharacterized protein YpmB
MKKLLTALFISLTLATGAAYAEADKQSPLTESQAVQLLKESKPLYSCEMHEHVYSDKEGKCPICGMNLTQASAIEGGKAVFKESKGSMNMDMKDMKMMEKK